MTPPTAEGGALRSQDIRTTGDPTGLDGAILRVNPDTGAAMPGNPNIGSADLNTRRIVAHGLRNPFRITVRPGTNEIWAGDVGWNTWEEINRIPSPTGGTTNFGWPCYEGAARQSAYDNLNLNVCENLYSAGSAAWTPPYYTYNHSAKVVTGETCPTGGSSISGLAFYTGGSFGPAYNGALFFSDYSRNCIWVMLAGANGLPDPATRQTFIAAAAGPGRAPDRPGAATSTTSTWAAARSGASAAPARTARRPRSRPRRRPRRGAADGQLRRRAAPATPTATRSPTPGTSTATACSPTRPRRRRRRTYTTPGTVTVGLRVSDPAG